MDNSLELDFNTDDYNGFYYTSDKQIRKMDDAFIISKIVEKYPDFEPSSSENMLKQVFVVIVKDTKFINELTKKYDLSVQELFSIIYRCYSFLFSPLYMTKIQRIVRKRAYAKSAKTAGRKLAGRARVPRRR